MTPRSLRSEGRGLRAAGASHVLPLAGQASLAIDGAAVRRRVGAWAAGLPPAERPNVEVVWRDALLVCDSIVALARATLGAADRPLWMVDVRVPGQPLELARWTGLQVPLLRRTIESLVAAEVLDGVSQVGAERVVHLRPEVLGDAPVLAAVRWDVVRERLGEFDAPVARLIVRELARRTSVEARAQGHFVSASQRELADAIGYSKASMRRHLDALVAAGVLASRSRDRTNSWHRLQPVAFDGEAADPPEVRIVPAGAADPSTPPGPWRERASPVRHVAGQAVSRERRGGRSDAIRSAEPAVDAGGERRHRLPLPATGSTPPAPAIPPDLRPLDAALTVEVNGVRIALPPGVDLTLEQDAQGGIWYRAGALRLGPVRFG